MFLLTRRLGEESGGALSHKGGADTLGSGTLDAVDQGKLSILRKLLDSGPFHGQGHFVPVEFWVVALGLAEATGHHLCVHNVNTMEASAVATCHVRVHLLHSPCQPCVAVLAVHIVCAAAGVVANGNPKVFHHVRILFPDLPARQNLPSSFLKLVKLVEKVPNGIEGERVEGRERGCCLG